MSHLSRTGVSLEEDLLKEFDRLIAKRGYQNRSEAIRDLIREALLTETYRLEQTRSRHIDAGVRPSCSESLAEIDRGSACSRCNGSGGHARASGSPLLPGSHHHEGAKQRNSGNRGSYAGACVASSWGSWS